MSPRDEQGSPNPVAAASRRDFAAAVEDNMVGYFSTWGRMPGAGWVERAEVAYLFTTGRIPFLNRVLRSRLPRAGIDEAIEHLLEEFARLPNALLWQVGPTSAPRSLASRLRRYGFSRAAGAPGMALQLPSRRAVPGKTLDLRITSADEEPALREWFEPFAPEIGLPKESLEGAIHARRACLLGEGTGFHHLLGRVNGVPVASASLYFRNGVAGIYDVATLPTWRRKGIGTSMTFACLEAARAHGVRLVILQASRVAVPMYRWFGFRRCCTLRVYERR